MCAGQKCQEMILVQQRSWFFSRLLLFFSFLEGNRTVGIEALQTKAFSTFVAVNRFYLTFGSAIVGKHQRQVRCPPSTLHLFSKENCKIQLKPRAGRQVFEWGPLACTGRSLDMKRAGVEHCGNGVISNSSTAGLSAGDLVSPLAVQPFLCWATAFLLWEEAENTNVCHCESVKRVQYNCPCCSLARMLGLLLLPLSRNV